MPDLDQLADRFVIEVANAWAGKGLPLNALANAVTAWGLSYATAEATPAEVAEGLQRMADAVMEGSPRSPRGLI